MAISVKNEGKINFENFVKKILASFPLYINTMH